jgi:uncharacterized protein (DUF427 family)
MGSRERWEHRPGIACWQGQRSRKEQCVATSSDGTESVWDYPRPPRVEDSGRRVRIVFAGRTVLDTTSAVRVLETSHPPTWYVPADAFVGVRLAPTGRRSVCEFKGRAEYYDLVAPGQRAVQAAWAYPSPAAGFERLSGLVAVYPARVERCLVDDEAVVAQDGDFYGGWITADVAGPFKGGPGTAGW